MKKFCSSHFKSTQHLQLSIFFIVMSNEYLVFSMNIAASFTIMIHNCYHLF